MGRWTFAGSVFCLKHWGSWYRNRLFQLNTEETGLVCQLRVDAMDGPRGGVIVLPVGDRSHHRQGLPQTCHLTITAASSWMELPVTQRQQQVSILLKTHFVCFKFVLFCCLGVTAGKAKPRLANICWPPTSHRNNHGWASFGWKRVEGSCHPGFRSFYIG